MEGEVSGDHVLLQKLRDSRRRFQRHMQQLLEKYNQPFEDAPVVQMSTLTYETPQGLRIWGGRLVKKNNKGQIQGSPEKMVSRRDSPMQATAGGDKLDLGVDSTSSDVDVTLNQEDLAARALTPTVPCSPLKDELRRKYLNQVDILLWSPLKDDLRRKYLNQVDILLQDPEYNDYGDGNDTCESLVPSLASPPRPAHGHCSPVSAEHPLEPPASSHPCPTDMAVVPRNGSVSWQETSGHSVLSSQSSVADDISNVTISDLYEGMLHSMSRLLSAQPSCVISTRTSIMRGWTSRRRHRARGRIDRTHCQGGRPTQRSSQKRPGPYPKPARERAVLRECQNFRDLSGQKAGLKLEKASFEVNKLQIWNELKGPPQKLSSLPHVDCGVMHHLDQENRLMTLKWLISPVKIVSRPRLLQGEGGNHHRELRGRFDRLHQEYCLSPRKRPHLTCLPSSSETHGHRASSLSLGGPWGVETHQPSRPFSRAKAKSLSEAFEGLGKQAIEVGRQQPQGDSSPSLWKTDSTWSPGCSEPTAGLLQGNPLGIFRKSSSLSKAISVPRVQPLGSARDRYDKIKEKFDQLHQKYCQKSSQQTTGPFCPRPSPDRAHVQVQNQSDFRKLDLDSSHQGPQKSPSSPQCHISSSLGSSTVEVHPSLWLALAAGGTPPSRAKRLRLSDPQVCARPASCQDPSRMVDKAIPRSGEEVHREKRKEEHTFWDGR